MSIIDDYLKTVEPSKRKELIRIRRLARQVVPRAEETISYGMPTLTYAGKPFLGFDAHSNHIGIYPYGAAPIRALKTELKAYAHSSGAIRIPLDRPIAKSLLTKLIKCKIGMIKAKSRNA
jgi:uncharacterized protein YdhG (YjbR/CyaY superfamily)